MTHPGLTLSSLTRTKGAQDPERAARIAAEVAAGIRTLEDIGAEYGITRERVRQLAKREGVTRAWQPVPAQPRFGRRVPCLTCNERVRSGRMRQHRLDAGHTTKPGGVVTARSLALMAEFYQRGLGYVALGEVIGIIPSDIRYHLRRVGYTPHPTGSRNFGGGWCMTPIADAPSRNGSAGSRAVRTGLLARPGRRPTNEATRVRRDPRLGRC